MNGDENVFASMNTTHSILSYKSCSELNFLIANKLQAQKDCKLALTRQFFESIEVEMNAEARAEEKAGIARYIAKKQKMGSINDDKGLDLEPEYEDS
jgi:hypothetical protein